MLDPIELERRLPQLYSIKKNQQLPHTLTCTRL
jgi:hypothetical protein